MEFVFQKASLFCAVLFAFAFSSGAQPTSSFSAPAASCLKETLSLSNSSTMATRYVWDFCNTDLQDANPFAVNVTTLPTVGSFFYNSIKLINYNGSNLAFVTDMNALKLYRINFGSDWSSTTPVIDDLGNPGGFFSSPGALDAVFDNGIWYFFVANLFQNKVTRITMGNGLLSAPTLAEDLGNFGSTLSTPIGIKTVLNGSSRLLFVSNLSSQAISVTDFPGSFSSAPGASHSLSSSLLVDPSGVDLINDGTNWFGVVSSFDNSGHTVLMNFGANPSSVPSFSDLGVVPGGRQVKIAKEGSNYVGFIRSENDGVYRILFGTDFSSPSTPTKLSPNLLNASRSLDVIKDTPTWKLFTIEATTGNMIRVDFIGNCQAKVSSNYSTQANPSGIQYLSSGNYSIELTAFDNSNSADVSNSVINVSPFTAPDIDFTKQNDCINNNVNFTSINQSGNINTHAWNFGDGGSSSSANPSYIFSTANNYDVSLTITDANGCSNNAQKSIQIFNPPQANFTPPSANPFCTGQNYLFTNISTFDNGSNPTWQWSVNGSNLSTTQDLSYQINSPTSQSIVLTASIPGCSTQSTQNINTVQVGPSLSFTSLANGCVNSPVAFTNTSTGSVLGYNWTFGDGNSSSQTDASNTFSSAGIFNVTLSASNAAGCQNSYSKSIPIYSNPAPDFSIDLPPFSCAGSASQFNDLTPALTDSNLSSWSWQFGDAANGISPTRSPAYTYSTAGNYNVSLQVLSNFGCTASVQKTITIFPSPQAAFTNSAACLNQSTQFTDASMGTIKLWQWKMPGTPNPINTQNTTFIFKSSSTFPVTLAVTGSNNCINQVTKNIVVPFAPVMDFSILYPCTGTTSQFQEINPGGNDPAVSWNWNFTSGSAVGNPANYSFPSSGLYTVTLTSTRQSQCVYSVSKNLSVVDGPIASFTPSSTGGPAPLSVAFNNNSTLADTFSWSFGDANNTTSTDTSPSFTYTQLGAFTVTLTATNILDCTNSSSKLIDVVVPSIDAALTSFMLADDPSTSSKRAVVTIQNNGNISFLNPVVSVDLGGNVSLKETVIGTVQAGSSLSKTLNMEIVPSQISYACAKLIVATDIFEDNNEQCVTLTQDEVVLSPYPNPASSEFTIEWINPSAEDVHVIVFKTNGQIAFDQLVNSPAGLTQFKIETSSWASALYLVQVTGSKSQKLYRVAVIN